MPQRESNRRKTEKDENGEMLPSLFYVLLVGRRTGMLGQPKVEARVNANLRGSGKTERDAIEDLLRQLRSRNGLEDPVDYSRLRVWRALWMPPAPNALSFLPQES
jgi:hypothetical protein